jgi:hypothetical protein
LAIAKQVAGELREMTREQAANLLEQVRLDMPDRRARLHFDAFANNLRVGDPRPFRNPYHWAAMYVSGLAEVQVRQEG